MLIKEQSFVIIFSRNIALLIFPFGDNPIIELNSKRCLCDKALIDALEELDYEIRNKIITEIKQSNLPDSRNDDLVIIPDSLFVHHIFKEVGKQLLVSNQREFKEFCEEMVFDVFFADDGVLIMFLLKNETRILVNEINFVFCQSLDDIIDIVTQAALPRQIARVAKAEINQKGVDMGLPQESSSERYQFSLYASDLGAQAFAAALRKTLKPDKEENDVF